jgi:hypothetical protein
MEPVLLAVSLNKTADKNAFDSLWLWILVSQITQEERIEGIIERSQRKEVAEEWWELHKEERHNLYFLQTLN